MLINNTNHYKKYDTSLGFTLIEQITTAFILSIFLISATPTYISFTNKSMLKNSAERLASDLHWARSEAMIYGSESNITINTVFSIHDNGWCYGFTENPTCDCTRPLGDSDACSLTESGTSQLKVTNSDQYSGKISMSNMTPFTNATRFNSVRGVSNSVNVRLSDNQDRSIDVLVNPLGRVHICSSTHADQLGYPAC